LILEQVKPRNLLHLGELAVDALQAEAEGAAVGGGRERCARHAADVRAFAE
jgi:hypothetical protein